MENLESTENQVKMANLEKTVKPVLPEKKVLEDKLDRKEKLV